MTRQTKNKEIDNIQQNVYTLEYRQKLILSALSNILEQNNRNGVNDYLLNLIRREL